MSDPIEVMMTEHRLIEEVLDALGSFVDRVGDGQGPDGGDLAKFVTFIREFADRKHHGKEEAILFTAMCDNGFPRQAGPVAVMLEEHGIGRDYVSQMAELVGAPTPWSDAQQQMLARAARGFSGMLRNHIMKEDQILYPMAASQLPPPVMAQVAERCDAFEQAHAARGDTARLETLGRELAAKYKA